MQADDKISKFGQAFKLSLEMCCFFFRLTQQGFWPIWQEESSINLLNSVAILFVLLQILFLFSVVRELHKREAVKMSKRERGHLRPLWACCVCLSHLSYQRAPPLSVFLCGTWNNNAFV